MWGAGLETPNDATQCRRAIRCRGAIHRAPRCAGSAGGRNELRPYTGMVFRDTVDDDDPMNVVWHDDECVRGNAGVVRRQHFPGRLHNLSGSIRAHLAIHDVTKQECPMMCANRQEIGSDLRIVIVSQANRTTVVTCRFAGHACSHSPRACRGAIHRGPVIIPCWMTIHHGLTTMRFPGSPLARTERSYMDSAWIAGVTTLPALVALIL